MSLDIVEKLFSISLHPQPHHQPTLSLVGIRVANQPVWWMFLLLTDTCSDVSAKPHRRGAESE